MTKKSLGSGLDGWIKDTKRSHDHLQEPSSSTPDPASPESPDPSSVTPDSQTGAEADVRAQAPAQSQETDSESSRPSMSIQVIPIADLEVPPPRLPPVENEDLEWLKASIFRDGQLQPVVVRRKDGRPWLVTGYRRLQALRDLAAENIIAVVHAQMSDEDARKVYISDNLPRMQADPTVLRDLVASVGTAELERWGVPPRLIKRSQALDEPQQPQRSTDLLPGILSIDDSSFEQEVVDAQEPVLVAVHLPGQLGSDEVQSAMIEAAGRWGDVKLCALDIMACEGPAVPQLIKVGRGFLEKQLPRVQLYHGGFQRREVTGARGEPAVDAEQLLEMLDDGLR